MQWAAANSGGPGRDSRAADDRILTFLDFRDHEGMTMRQIASALGATRSAVSGAVSRIGNEPEPECLCRKAKNKDGGMARLWWKGGSE